MRELDDFRARVRDFLATHAAPAGSAAGGTAHHDDGDGVVARGKAFQNALADAGLAALLDAAEDIVNAAAPDIISEFGKPKRRFGKRKKRK